MCLLYSKNTDSIGGVHSAREKIKLLYSDDSGRFSVHEVVALLVGVEFDALWE